MYYRKLLFSQRLAVEMPFLAYVTLFSLIGIYHVHALMRPPTYFHY